MAFLMTTTTILKTFKMKTFKMKTFRMKEMRLINLKKLMRIRFKRRIRFKMTCLMTCLKVIKVNRNRRRKRLLSNSLKCTINIAKKRMIL